MKNVNCVNDIALSSQKSELICATNNGIKFVNINSKDKKLSVISKDYLKGQNMIIVQVQ